MTDERGTCRYCRREGLRLTDKGLVWPHRSNSGDLCPPDAPLVDSVRLPDYYPAAHNVPNRTGHKRKLK